MRERDIERHLVQRVKELGGEVRKVKWVGRNSAPDRLVMLPHGQRRGRWSSCKTFFVELKNPETIKTFPADALERAQAREHKRMRGMGQLVEVVGTIEQVEALLA
jgi:hypothetical protein